jgi:hypothetical protein
MAGYCGYSMSNNAVDAYNSGEKPLSRWTKAEIIEGVQEAIKEGDIEPKFDLENLKKLTLKSLKEVTLIYTSWHHTSNHFNETDFFSINVYALNELTNEKIEQIVKESKEEKAKKKAKKKEPEEEVWKCAFLIWEGTRKHPKATEVIEVGTIKGNWFYRKNGTKKKVDANGFRKIERVQ